MPQKFTKNGGFTELLGGTYRQNWDAADGVGALLDNNPLFIVENSQASLCFSSWSTYEGAPPYKILVKETRNGTTKQLVNKANGGTSSGAEILFVGYSEKPSLVTSLPLVQLRSLRANTAHKFVLFDLKGRQLRAQRAECTGSLSLIESNGIIAKMRASLHNRF